jgi:hypothetical protein
VVGVVGVVGASGVVSVEAAVAAPGAAASWDPRRATSQTIRPTTARLNKNSRKSGPNGGVALAFVSAAVDVAVGRGSGVVVG